MNAATAYAMLKPLGLSVKDEKQLALMLNGLNVSRVKAKKGITVSWAKRDFIKRMKKLKND